jgi:hypothetical protein
LAVPILPDPPACVGFGSGFLEKKMTSVPFCHRQFLKGLFLLIWSGCFLLHSIESSAFNPPKDEWAGLSLEIEGPSQLEGEDQVPAFIAAIGNQRNSPFRGVLSIEGVDGWTAIPQENQPVSVEPMDSLRIGFRIKPGFPLYAEIYPIHVRLIPEDKTDKPLHAVFFIESRVQKTAAQAGQPIDYPPVEPHAGRTGLASWPGARVFIQEYDQPPAAMPAGWTGAESITRGSFVRVAGMDRGETLPAIGIHPPWYQGRSGILWAEYPVRLPDEGPVRLEFATAIRDHYPERGEPASDGVTFRVRVAPMDAAQGELGPILFERHTDTKIWLPGAVDLTEYAGRLVRIQLECDPGPARNTACDQAYWGAPVLIAGAEPSGDQASTGWEDRAPDWAEPVPGWGRCMVWLGRRGSLDARIGFVADTGERLLMDGFHVQLEGAPVESPASMIPVLNIAKSRDREGALRVEHALRLVTGETCRLVARISMNAGILEVGWTLEDAPEPRPWRVVRLEDVACGPWSRSAEKVYAGAGNVIVGPEAFRLPFDGHRLSTSFIGLEFGPIKLVQSVDSVPDALDVRPAQRHYSLHAAGDTAFRFVPRPDIWAAVRNWREQDARPAASGVDDVAGRFVFDLWGGRYAPSAERLARAFRYGLTDSMVVWHNWQRWGYDYRLPDIFPPNPALGTSEEFRRLADTCREAGVLFAPHDNYIDLYPDADGFSYGEIAFHETGTPVRAWLNEGRGAQSYRWRADRVEPFLKRNLEWIEDAFEPTAYFIDVWSSIGPYDYWDWDGGFHPREDTRRTWGRLFAWIRQRLGDDAPQISESGHDALIGWLDGAQANHLRVDPDPPAGGYEWATWKIQCEEAERVPWFDMAYHDRFVLHGAGYEVRFRAGLDRTEHGIYSADYISTEILTGRPAMAPEAFSADVVRKYWLTHDLMRALALRRMESVEFEEGDIQRQKVVWENGVGSVWVNRNASSEWSCAGHRLPPFGFYANVRDSAGSPVEVCMERWGEDIVEWSRSAEAVYFRARSSLRECNPVAGLQSTGGVRATRDGGSVVLTLLPSTRSETFWIPKRGIWAPGDIQGSLWRSETEDGDQGPDIQATDIGDFWRLQCPPGVFSLRE